MSNRLKRGADRLAARMAATSTSTVTYVRDSTTATVSAVIGFKRFRVAMQYVFFKYVTSRDFLIEATALAAYINPAAGDEIRETGGDGTVRIYRVMAPEGEQTWEWSDSYHNTFRIHTKYIKDLS